MRVVAGLVLIVAVVTALQEWFEMDHEARLAGYERRLQAIASELQGAPGVTPSIVRNDGPSARVLRLAIDPGRARSDVASIVDTLWSGTPAIAVGRDGDAAITVNPATLREEDDGLVAARIGNLLL